MARLIVGFSFFAFAMVWSFIGYAQPGWEWVSLPEMPESVANNAVVEAMSNDTLCVYSFCGIDESLEPAGIHLKSFKYNTVSQVWSILADVPDQQGKIAAGASFVNGLIYVVGGYYVNEDFSELSSDDVHVFDPNTDSWLPDAANIPVPIDDHVQVVKDDLIYIVTGWSDTQNVPDVQIFDTSNNIWLEGTSTPNNGIYKAFGASGTIVGDCIYYHGGVNGAIQFVANSRMRRGCIDPNDPTQIEWDSLDQSPGVDGYRSACMSYQDRMFWVGGGATAYNFDALAYNGSGAVSPEQRILTYYASYDLWEDAYGSPHPIMDLRGIAKVNDNQWIICGGIGDNREVLNSTYLLSYDESVSIQYQEELQWHIQERTVYFNETMSDIKLMNAQGKTIQSSQHTNQVSFEQPFYGLAIVQAWGISGSSYRFKVYLP